MADIKFIRYPLHYGVILGDHTAGVVLGVLEYATKIGGWSDGREALAAMLGLNVRTLARVLAMLAGLGLVDISATRPATYTVNAERLADLRGQNVLLKEDKMSSKKGQNVPIEGQNVLQAPIINKYIKKLKKGKEGKKPLFSEQKNEVGGEQATPAGCVDFSESERAATADEKGVVLELFRRHFESVKNAPFLPNFARITTESTDLAEQLHNLARRQLEKQGVQRDPSLDEFEVVARQFISGAWEVRDKWEDRNWSMGLLTRNFSQFLAKIVQNVF